jgi:hypothetical protein
VCQKEKKIFQMRNIFSLSKKKQSKVLMTTKLKRKIIINNNKPKNSKIALHFFFPKN